MNLLNSCTCTCMSKNRFVAMTILNRQCLLLQRFGIVRSTLLDIILNVNCYYMYMYVKCIQFCHRLIDKNPVLFRNSVECVCLPYYTILLIVEGELISLLSYVTVLLRIMIILCCQIFSIKLHVVSITN